MEKAYLRESGDRGAMRGWAAGLWLARHAI